ncbi:hypothetical protein, variant [Aphanomyces invadans]|uniref:Purple acid phosphatase n=1 Tax=Aphanomyces invadans TaxID=157072 RepID=A0A024TEA4_9STRA|nr:hypothetical protein, variant [Aphanomyces invadans]ETV91692.1 hypothetical protein, variant [Aphanomyces invadans]|eukprot:XP_008879618.1 hypothetical protein, variant [Aphanomyces invadans]
MRGGFVVLAALIGIVHGREVPWRHGVPSLCFEMFASPEALGLGEDLVVSWTNVDTHAADYVTLSCGPTVDNDDYIERINVTASSSHSVRFADLHMLRCVYVASYFHYRRDAFVLLGQVIVPMRMSIDSPQHGHLALNDRVDQMVLMYNTASNRTTPSVRATRVADPPFDSVAAPVTVHYGTSSTYTASDMCHQPATIVGQQWFRHPGYMHTVVIDGLFPDCMYAYQFGNDMDGWSEIYTFRSRPLSATNATVKWIAYGDMGVDNSPAAVSTALHVSQDILRGYNGFLLHFGDISYARGRGLQWDKYFYLIQDVATRIPYMVSMGNHEYDYIGGDGSRDPSHPATPNGFHPSWGNYGVDSLGECGVPTVHRFTGPANGNGLFWYSFDYGPIHVVQISSEHDFMPGSVQHAWLEANLASVDRSLLPWVVLTAHRMMYTTQSHEDADYNVSLHFRAAIEPLLRQYRVNLVLVWRKSPLCFYISCRSNARTGRP